MRKARCKGEEGHYFDLDVTNICPHCGSSEYTLVEDESVHSIELGYENGETIPLWENPGIPETEDDDESAGTDSVPPFHNDNSVIEKKRMSPFAILALFLGLLLICGTIMWAIMSGLIRKPAESINEGTASQNIDNQTDGSKATGIQFDGCFHDGEAFVIEGEKNERLIVAGYTHSNSEGVQFTIPLSKYFGDMELNLDELRVNIRHSTGGLLLGGYDKDGHDVINDSRFTVVTKKVAGCYVTITVNNSEGFGIADQMPVTITIHNMRLTFSDKNE